MTHGGDSGGPGPRGREDVVFRAVDGDWVLYDPRSRDLHVLNVTAAAVWSCCDGSMEAEGIARELAETLEGAPDLDRVRADVERTLDRFRADGLLE